MRSRSVEGCSIDIRDFDDKNMNISGSPRNALKAQDIVSKSTGVLSVAPEAIVIMSGSSR